MSEMPRGWVLAPLRAVTRKITDGTHHSPENLPTGRYMYVTAKNIKPWGIDLSNITYVDEATHKEIYGRSPVEKNDVLYIKDGATTGIAALNNLNQPFSILSSVALIKPEHQVIDAAFLTHWLNSPETLAKMMDRMTGTAIRRLTLRTISGQSIRLPPLAEQKRIVAKIDSLISCTSRARKDLDRVSMLMRNYKSRILSLAFSGRLTQDFRDPRSPPKPERTGLPLRWTMKLLGDISEIQGGIQVGRKRSHSTELIEVPYLRVANVQRGWLNLDEVKSIAVTPAEKRRLLLQKGDILMNEGGDRDKLGRGWVWDAQIPECIHQNHVFRIRLIDSALPPEFVSHYANEQGQQYFIDQGTQTTNLASISRRKVAALPIPIPPADEAEEIVRRINVAFAWIDRVSADHAAALNMLPRLDAAILSKAFRGELVPQDPTDEPADKLLDRTRAEPEKMPNPERVGTVVRKKAQTTMIRKLEDVLSESVDWLSAQEAFRRCGIGDGTETDALETLYAELRALDKAGRLIVEPVIDEEGRKLHDQLKLKAA